MDTLSSRLSIRSAHAVKAKSITKWQQKAFTDNDLSPNIGNNIPIAHAIFMIFGYWLFYILIVSLRAYVLDFPSQDILAERRLVVAGAGMIFTFFLYLILRGFETAPFIARIILAFVSAIPLAYGISIFNYFIFSIYDPAAMFANPQTRDFITDYAGIANRSQIAITEFALVQYFFFVSWASFYLAVSYANQVRGIERRAANFAKAAQEAQLRSLRYQVNPHFLFNTLNSLSTLVLRERSSEAEQMILNLSKFYRTSLFAAPLDDVTLGDEVYLQKLYLDIEAVRFPHRLRTKLNIEDNAVTAMVPALILQPLVENAIKYGVALNINPVIVTITAKLQGKYLLLTVHDDGDKSNKNKFIRSESTGIGLANVRDRLQARFGKAASLQTTLTENSFAVELKIPAIFDKNFDKSSATDSL